MATGIAGVKDGGKVGRSVAVIVGDTVGVLDGFGVKVGRGEGVRVAVEVDVGLVTWESEGAMVGDIGKEVTCGSLERVRKKIEPIRTTIITPNPPKSKTNKGGRSDGEFEGGSSGEAEVIGMKIAG